TEERPITMLVDEPDGPVGQVVGDEPIAGHQLAVVVERRVEVMPPVSGREAVVLVEPAAVRVVRILRPVVPLAEAGGGVAGGLELVGDRLLIEVEAFAAGGDVADATAGVVAAGQKLGPRRRADWLDEEPVEPRPVL